jgi:thiamine transport system permease protein
MDASNRERWSGWIMALPPLGAVLLLFLLPYGAALAPVFAPAAGAGPFGEGRIAALALFTLVQAALSALGALVLGLPAAWFLSAFPGGGGGPVRFFRALTALPFALPPILAVLGFILFFGNSGWINRGLMALTGAEEGPLHILYRPAALVLVHAFYNFPLVIRLAGDGMADARRAYAPAAAALGAGPVKTALTVLLPLALPSILAAGLLAFLYSFTSFAVVLVLGGGPSATTLAVEIYRYARLSLDMRSAAALALVETGIALGVFCLYLLCERKSRRSLSHLPPAGLFKPRRAGAVLYGLVLMILVLGPLASILVESFRVRSSRMALAELSLDWWAAIGERALPALGRSLAMAALAASLAVFLAALAALAARPGIHTKPRVRGILIPGAMTVPLASSGIVLGLGWLALYGRESSRTMAAAALVQAVMALPFAYRSIEGGFRDIPENTTAAAMVFGAGPLKRLLTLELPLIFRRFRSAWAFAAALSLGELNTVIMLGLENWETLPLLIYRAAGAYRYGAACAAGTLLILAAGLCFLLSEAGRPAKGRRHGA